MKHKRVIAIAIAILFLAVLFLIKNWPEEEESAKIDPGLNYAGTETLEELVAKDTDSDGVSDWEEGLWGTDLNKKDSDDDGEIDKKEIEKLKAEQVGSEAVIGADAENLNQTETFSRGFFASIAALSQSGQINTDTVEALTDSLAYEINKPSNYTKHSVSELKIGGSSKTDIQNYNSAMRDFYQKYPPSSKIISILQESIANDVEEIDTEKLKKLNPAISDLEYIISAMLKISVPGDLSILHLNLLNSLEEQRKGLQDIKLVDTDTILAIKAISEYANTTSKVAQAVNNIIIAIQVKLK